MEVETTGKLRDPHLTAYLAPEITDMIIDFLYDDSCALAAMSLVCKSFLPSTRLHLFERITLDRRRPRGKLTQARFDEAAHIFASLAPFVRHLDVFSTHRDSSEDLNKWLQAAFTLFAVLKGVTSLSIRFWSWGRFEPEVRREMFAHFGGLLQLSLGDGIFPDAVDIIESVLQFPALERLCLDDILWDIDSIGTASVPLETSGAPTLSNLQTLTIGGRFFEMVPIMNWFLSLDVLPPVHTFQITSASYNEWKPAGLLIRSFGRALKHLTLGSLSPMFLKPAGTMALTYCLTSKFKLIAQQTLGHILSWPKYGAAITSSHSWRK
jgi:hypothetical protein